MKTYVVHAVPGDGWWGLTVPEAPGAVSQVRSLAQAEEYVREAIAFVTGAAQDSFAVQVVPQLPQDLVDGVARAKEAAAAAEAAQSQAAALSRRVVAELAAAGFNGRETAVILGVSKQRVSQLAAAARADNAAVPLVESVRDVLGAEVPARPALRAATPRAAGRARSGGRGRPGRQAGEQDSLSAAAGTTVS